jgi:hypothetical protein
MLVLALDAIVQVLQEDRLPMTVPDISRNRNVPLEEIVIHGQDGPRILHILYTQPNITSL